MTKKTTTQIAREDLSLLEKYPQLLEGALEKAAELDEIAAKEAEDAEIEAKLVPILGVEEAAVRTRERRQRVEAQKVAAEEGIANQIAEAEERERRKLEKEKRRNFLAAEAARRTELLAELKTALSTTVRLIETIYRDHDGADWRIGQVFREVGFLRRVGTALQGIFHEEKWGG